MLLNETNYKIWYRAYSKQFDTTTKYVKSRKGIPATREKVSYETFKEYFIEEHTDNPNLSGMQISKSLAKEQIYQSTHRQAIALAKAHAKHFGGESSMFLEMQYRMGAESLGDKNLLKLIESERATLAGSESQKNIYIGQRYFGSE